MGVNLSPEDKVDVFGDTDPDAYAEESASRWGDTDAFRTSDRRTSSYGKQDWLSEEQGRDEIEARFAELLTSGVPADSGEATALAEAHRQHISRWFYDCSPQMHVGLAQMYVADPRFTAHYDHRAPGLAQYVHDAILANAATGGAADAASG
jgi:hypothetical protein